MEFDYIWTKRLTLLTPVLVVMAIFLAGGGHGWYIPAILLFPFGLISLLFTSTVKVAFMLIAVLQYPVYGLLLDLMRHHKHFKSTAFSIAALHVAVAVLIVMCREDTWR